VKIGADDKRRLHNFSHDLARLYIEHEIHRLLVANLSCATCVRLMSSSLSLALRAV